MKTILAFGHFQVELNLTKSSPSFIFNLFPLLIHIQVFFVYIYPFLYNFLFPKIQMLQTLGFYKYALKIPFTLMNSFLLKLMKTPNELSLINDLNFFLRISTFFSFITLLLFAAFNMEAYTKR